MPTTTSRAPTVEGDRLVRLIDIMVDQLRKRGRAVFLRELRAEIGRKPVVRAINELKRGKPLSDPLIQSFEGVALSTDRLIGIYEDAFSKGGRSAAKVYANLGTFAADHPRALEWSQYRAGARIAEINNSTREGVRGIISEALRRNTPSVQVADQLRSSIGLTLKQTRQVADYRQRMFDKGMPRARANVRASQYASSLLDQRVDAIAETEMAWSVESGKREYWSQAKEAGLLPMGARLVWVTENDDRVDDVCQLMEGVEADVDGFFSTPYGPQLSGPLHPRCRCQVVLR